MTASHAPSWKWWVCGVLMLATFLNYMDRQALAVSLPELKQRYNIHEGRIGLLEGCFGFAFAGGSVLFGLIADVAGPRRLYPTVLAGWSLAGVATALAGEPAVTVMLEFPNDDPGAGPFRWLLLCRTLLGICEAGHWPCALLTVRQFLPAKDRPLGNGLLQSGASLGAVLVPLYVEVVERAGGGWEFAFWSVGLVGLLWIPLWFAFLARTDFTTPPPPAAAPADALTWPAFLIRIALLAVVVSCLNVSWQFLRAWLPLFLQDFHHYSRELTRASTAGYFIATDIGCLCAGVVVKLLVARGRPIAVARTIGFIGFALLTSCAAIVPWVGESPFVVVPLFMLAGAGILGLHPYYYAFVQDLPAKWMAVLSGGLAATGWIVSSLFQILVGDAIKQTKSYDTGLIVVGLAPLLALGAVLVMGAIERGERK